MEPEGAKVNIVIEVDFSIPTLRDRKYSNYRFLV